MIVGADFGIVGREFSVKQKVYIKIASGYISRIYESKPNTVDEYFEECVIVPGFINMHTHVGDSVARERAYGLPIERSVAPPDGLKFRILSSAPKEKLAKGIRTAIYEMLSSGITTFVDFREGGVEGVRLLRRVVEEIGINAVIMGRPDSSRLEDVLAIADGIGLSSINRYRDEVLIGIHKVVKSSSKLVAYHASETRAQREKSIRMYGISDIARGVKILDPDFIVHVTYADRGDLELLARLGKVVVLCPRANGYFGLGPPPVKLVVDLGVKFCIGTDNVMINSPNMFREFDFLVRIARIQGIILDPKCLLESVTILPAEILGLRAGAIDTGLYADFFVFDLTRPNVAYVDDILKAIVLRGSERNVVCTYVRGKKLYEG